MTKQVIGTYKTVDEALEVVNRLRSMGYSQKNILLVANKDVQDSIPENYEKNINDFEEKITPAVEEEAPSFWQNVRAAFMIREPKKKSERSVEDLLYSYQDEIDSGAIAIVVNSFTQDNRGEKIDLGPAYGEDKLKIPGIYGRGLEDLGHKKD